MDSTLFGGLSGLEIVTDARIAPPPSNRGAQKTKAIISLDWLTFTAPIAELGRFMELLGMGEEWVRLERGMWGYPEQLARGTTRLLMGATARPDEMCVVCSGVTCMELREKGVSDEEFLRQVLPVSQNVTRLDVAFDTVGGALSMPRIREHLDASAVVSRFKTWEPRGARRISEPDTLLGHTLQFGSRQSASFLRIYDKGLETGTMGPNQWVRCELEFKKDNAAAAARLIVDQGIEVATGLLSNLIEFKELGQTDENKSRHVAAGWWADFLASAEKIRLGLPSPKPSLERAVAWVKKQVGPTLAAILEAFGGDTSVLYEVVNDGRHRQKVKHRIIASSGMRFSPA